jgi:hypothetical protein
MLVDCVDIPVPVVAAPNIELELLETFVIDLVSFRGSWPGRSRTTSL